MKTIAFYLPQFHKVKENDEWWGEGYTEWTAVKNAKPLFDGHYQQHVPLNRYYYDLMDKETMLWQTDLMEKYGVDGMCFYHYYFENGRRILEKPAENLLRWRDIRMPYCFCWANESWARTWSGIKGKNSWNELIEEVNSSLDKDESGILLKQAYGGITQWAEHYDYLRPFFCDERYIKIDNKPLFLIYRADEVYCFHSIMTKWNEMAIRDGFNGIFFVGRHTNDDCFNNYFIQEVFSNGSNDKGNIIKYRDHSRNIIKNALTHDKRMLLCGNTGYDDTPRRGSRGKIVDELDPDVFYRQMKALYYITEKRQNEIVFINAWNEWGEGMHLEPDEKFGYSFLEANKKAREDYKFMNKCETDELDELRKSGEKEKLEYYKEKSIKYESINHILENWISLYQKGGSIGALLRRNGYKRVAVYGYGVLGKRLVSELLNGGFELTYVIDRNKRIKESNIDFITPNEVIAGNEDIVIVTTVNDYNKVYSDLRGKTEVPLISIDELIFEV